MARSPGSYKKGWLVCLSSSSEAASASSSFEQFVVDGRGWFVAVGGGGGAGGGHDGGVVVGGGGGFVVFSQARMSVPCAMQACTELKRVYQCTPSSARLTGWHPTPVANNAGEVSAVAVVYLVIHFLRSLPECAGLPAMVRSDSLATIQLVQLQARAFWQRRCCEAREGVEKQRAQGCSTCFLTPGTCGTRWLTQWRRWHVAECGWPLRPLACLRLEVEMRLASSVVHERVDHHASPRCGCCFCGPFPPWFVAWSGGRVWVPSLRNCFFDVVGSAAPPSVELLRFQCLLCSFSTCVWPPSECTVSFHLTCHLT